MSVLEKAVSAVLGDLRDRKFLKYLFAENPENEGAYGYIDTPLDAETQAEIAQSLVRAVLQAIRTPSEGMAEAGWFRVSMGHPEQSDMARGPETACWTAMIDTALEEG